MSACDPKRVSRTRRTEFDEGDLLVALQSCADLLRFRDPDEEDETSGNRAGMAPDRHSREDCTEYLPGTHRSRDGFGYGQLTERTRVVRTLSDTQRLQKTLCSASRRRRLRLMAVGLLLAVSES